MTKQLFDQVAEHVRETAMLEATLALLEWDERTGLPAQAGEYRAEQATLLSGLIHRRKTDPRLGEHLEALAESELSAGQDAAMRREAATIARLTKAYRRSTKLPIELVQALSKATVLGQQAWERARRENDWAAFEPHLAGVFKLRLEEANHLKEDGGSAYDALLDQYEEGARSAELTQVFAALRDELVSLVQQLGAAPQPPTGESWRPPVSVDRQRQVSRWVAEKIGFCFERGRLDETSHPFCTTLGPHDCRILSRYQADYFPAGFYGTLHEAGHGIYEQGLPTDWYGLPPGSYASLGIHESQSRLWENMVGRSHAFWRWCFPEVRRQVGGAWSDLSVDTVYADANLVRPSLIRVEADEVTYNLHILIRFELEQELLSGALPVTDAPEAWNARYDKYLGIRPTCDRDGILQDVHWSAGLVGYFPTYTLGNLVAAQLMQAAEQGLTGLEEQFAAGEFAPMLQWLRERVHQHGASLHPGELVRQATGKPLDAKPLVSYLRRKLEPLYSV